METLHATGDWYASEGQIVQQDTGKTLAVIPYYDNTDEEKTANANIMASSPMLLDALREMVRMYEAVEPAGGWQGVYEQATYAIQQATNP